MSDVIKCPHCKDVEMDHVILEHQTHVYVCEECPNVMLEFSLPHQLETLGRFLKGDESVVIHRFAKENEFKDEEPMYLDQTDPVILMDMEGAATVAFADYFDGK